jgi:hypothetical protein
MATSFDNLDQTIKYKAKNITKGPEDFILPLLPELGQCSAQFNFEHGQCMMKITVRSTTGRPVF